MGEQLNIQGTRTFASIRPIQAAGNKWDDASSRQRNAMAALAAASMVVGAGSMATSCERRRKTNVVDPKAYPSMGLPQDSNVDDSTSIQATSSTGPKDPMTVYQKFAMKREAETANSKSARATSPSGGSAPPVGNQYLSELSAEELRIEEATRKAKQHSGGLKLFSGNGNMALALEIARHLGINLGKATVGRFADGEANVVIHENIRGKDVYIIQPTCPPVNDNIMELLLMVSTLRRASARRITVVIPYYGYARQDRKMQVSQCDRRTNFVVEVFGSQFVCLNNFFHICRLVSPFPLLMWLG